MCRHMIQARQENGQLLCVFCDADVTLGGPVTKLAKPIPSLTDAEIARLREMSESAPPEVFGDA